MRPGQTRTVTFSLDRTDVGVYDDDGRLVVEPGAIDVDAGGGSDAPLHATFRVTGGGG